MSLALCHVRFLSALHPVEHKLAANEPQRPNGHGTCKWLLFKPLCKCLNRVRNQQTCSHQKTTIFGKRLVHYKLCYNCLSFPLGAKKAILYICKMHFVIIICRNMLQVYWGEKLNSRSKMIPNMIAIILAGYKITSRKANILWTLSKRTMVVRQGLLKPIIKIGRLIMLGFLKCKSM